MGDKPPDYPLEQVLGIKKDRVKDAERTVSQKKEALKKEEEKMQKVKLARDQVKQHYMDKITQLRHALDEGTTTDKIMQMKVYLKIVVEDLKKEEKKVQEQQKHVDAAKKQVEEAKAHLKEKQKEVDKLDMHKKDWSQDVKKELEKKVASEQDELGSLMYLAQRKKRS